MPDWQQYVRDHLPALRLKSAREAGIVEELALQLEQAYAEARAAGHPEAEAERLAKSQLPDWRSLARDIEISQPQHKAPADWFRGIPADLRHAFRVLRRSPVFTVVAIATLAIGIGGCIAIFSLIDAVLLRSIEYRDPSQLVMVWEKQDRRGVSKNVAAMADYLDWKARNHVFGDMSLIVDRTWNVSGRGEPAVLTGFSVNERFLPMLGTQPLIGRGFSPEETQPKAAPVVLLSHKTWVQMFGASSSALGATIRLNDRTATVIGVLPANFPWLGKPLDILAAAQLDPSTNWRVRAGRFLRVVARLKPGVSIATAQTEMNLIAQQLEIEYPDFNKNWGVNLIPLSEQFASGARTALWVLMGSVAFVLLIACSNVANLMLARSVVREREMAVRAALGGTVGRLVRLLMIESLTLATIGGSLGLAGAYVAIHLVQTRGPQDIGRLDTAGINPTVALFAVAATVLTGIAFGLVPALGARHLNLGTTLKEGGRGAFNSRRGERLRSIFVVAQVGLATVLLTGAILLVQSFYRLSHVPTGFDSDNLLTGSVAFSGNVSNADLGRMCDQIIRKLRALPAVENASFITFLPFSGLGSATDFRVVGRPPAKPGEAPVTDVRVVQPGYFETMRIPLRRGRFFSDADNLADSPRHFVINETLARQIFGTQDALGQSLIVAMGDDKPGDIIGITGDTKLTSLDGDIRPMVYYVQAQLPISFGTFVMRTKVPPEQMAAALTAAIREVQRDQPISNIQSMNAWIGLSIARMRFQTALLAGFALIAMSLAVIGVYGVMAYAVEQRTQEIGIRLALGGEPARLRFWIAARGLRLSAIGLFLGILIAAASTSVLSTLLYSVKPGDPITFLTAAAVLSMACIAASYLPARRATSIDPANALRAE